MLWRHSFSAARFARTRCFETFDTLADSMFGEVTPAMAVAVGQSNAKRLLIPINQCENIVLGASSLSVSDIIGQILQYLMFIGKLLLKRNNPLRLRGLHALFLLYASVFTPAQSSEKPGAADDGQPGPPDRTGRRHVEIPCKRRFHSQPRGQSRQ